MIIRLIASIFKLNYNVDYIIKRYAAFRADFWLFFIFSAIEFRNIAILSRNEFELQLKLNLLGCAVWVTILTIVNLSLIEVIFKNTLFKAVYGLKTVKVDGKSVRRIDIAYKNIFNVIDICLLYGAYRILFSDDMRKLGEVFSKTATVPNTETWQSWQEILNQEKSTTNNTNVKQQVIGKIALLYKPKFIQYIGVAIAIVFIVKLASQSISIYLLVYAVISYVVAVSLIAVVYKLFVDHFDCDKYKFKQ